MFSWDIAGFFFFSRWSNFVTKNRKFFLFKPSHFLISFNWLINEQVYFLLKEIKKERKEREKERKKEWKNKERKKKKEKKDKKTEKGKRKKKEEEKNISSSVTFKMFYILCLKNSIKNADYFSNSVEKLLFFPQDCPILLQKAANSSFSNHPISLFRLINQINEEKTNILPSPTPCTV